MLKDFNYKDGKMTITAPCTEKESAQVESFVREITEKVKAGEGEMLVVCLSLEDGEADITLQSRNAKEFVPEEKESKYFVKDHSCRVYIFRPDENKSIHYTTGGFGTNYRDEKEGNLHSFFPNKPEKPWTEDILFHLLVKYGITPTLVSVTTLFWTDLRDYGMGEEEKNSEAWTIEEDFNIPDPFNHEAEELERICLYSHGKTRVYTRSVPDDEHGGKVCKVYFDFKGFMTAVCEDFQFRDDEDTRDRFLQALNKTEEIEIIIFREEAVERMGRYCKPGWTQIFKQNNDITDNPMCGAPAISDDEMEYIQRIAPGCRTYRDETNGLVAFELGQKGNAVSRDICGTIVAELNNSLEKNGLEPCWYLGDEDEQYVFVD